MSIMTVSTTETDPKKQNMAVQQHAAQIDSNTSDIATNTTDIATIQGDYASKTTANTLAGVQTVSNNTASSSTSTGAIVVTGGVGVGGAGNFGGNLKGAAVLPTSAPGTAWGLDCQNCIVVVSGSSNSVLPDGAGLILLTDGTVTGATGIYVTGGSAVALIGQSTGTSFVTPTTTPAANKYCVAFNGTHYAVYNGNASAITFTMAMIRTRPTT